MLVDYREVFCFFFRFIYLFFLPLLDRDPQTHKVYKQQHAAKLTQRHTLVLAVLTITVMSSKGQTIHGVAVPSSKAGLRHPEKEPDKEFWDILSFFSLSILLYLPPPPTTYFHSFSIRSSLSPGISNTSAGGRITDKNPGVLDSATLAGARHILACPTSCHIELKKISRA